MERLFKAFEAAGRELFLVGGAVRELARGIDFALIDDLDFCTNALPQESLQILRAANLLIYDVGIEFGTVGTVLYHSEREGYPKDCQITTYRCEEYYQRGSRHPEVRYGTTLGQDLQRRDFSINSIAMNARGEYIDPYDGRADLERGLLRVVGDPMETLAEDPLRILRVGRFIAKLGFEADPSLTQACRERARNILDISRERWLQEMTKLLKGAHAARGLEFLHEVEILGVILPEVERFFGDGEPGFDAAQGAALWAHTLRALTECEPVAAQRWAALLLDIERSDEHNLQAIEEVAARFKFDKATAREVKALVRTHALAQGYEPGWSDAQVRRLVRELDPYLEGALALAHADPGGGDQEKIARKRAHLRELGARIQGLEAMSHLRPSLPTGFGNVAMSELGLAPGPVIGQIKDFLEDAMIEGDLGMNLTQDDYIDYLRAHARALITTRA